MPCLLMRKRSTLLRTQTEETNGSTLDLLIEIVHIASEDLLNWILYEASFIDIYNC